MARISQQVKTQATATTEVTVEPSLKKKLEQRLEVYRRLDAEFDKAKAALDKEAANIEGYFEQIGAGSVRVEGHAMLTEVKGTTSKLDKKLFVKQGGTLAQLENATITKPKKSYVLITLEKR